MNKKYYDDIYIYKYIYNNNNKKKYKLYIYLKTNIIFFFMKYNM